MYVSSKYYVMSYRKSNQFHSCRYVSSGKLARCLVREHPALKRLIQTYPCFVANCIVIWGRLDKGSESESKSVQSSHSSLPLFPFLPSSSSPSLTRLLPIRPFQSLPPNFPLPSPSPSPPTSLRDKGGDGCWWLSQHERRYHESKFVLTGRGEENVPECYLNLDEESLEFARNDGSD